MIRINFSYLNKDGEYSHVEVDDQSGQPIKLAVEEALKACKQIDKDIQGKTE